VKRPVLVAFWMLVLCGVFLTTVAAGGVGAPRRGRGGETAPDFTLPAVAGGDVSLHSLRGQPVLINFWATWCPDCKVEMPEIARLRSAVGGQVAILGVDEGEPAPVVSDFLSRTSYGWTFLLDQSGAVAGAYGVHALPTSLFLDASGVVRQSYVGPMSLGQMRAFLREAEREPGQAPGRAG
jgi:thiol-disulfide isomerase/thioredoxin